MRLFYFIAIICFASGCVYLDGTPARLVTPMMLNYKIASADHIIITNLPAGQRDSPRVEAYSLTITNQEMERIIRAISSLQTSVDNHVYDIPTSYEWQLQFYKGTELLGAVDLSKDSVLDGSRGFSSSPLVFDGGWEYPAPRILRKLYHRVTEESQEHH